jgi:hypothetical protein
MEWNRILDRCEGIGEPMLPWEDELHEPSRTLELRLGVRIRRFPRICLELRTGRVDLIQDVYVQGLEENALNWTKEHTFFGQTN